MSKQSKRSRFYAQRRWLRRAKRWAGFSHGGAPYRFEGNAPEYIDVTTITDIFKREIRIR